MPLESTTLTAVPEEMLDVTLSMVALATPLELVVTVPTLLPATSTVYVVLAESPDRLTARLVPPERRTI